MILFAFALGVSVNKYFKVKVVLIKLKRDAKNTMQCS